MGLKPIYSAQEEDKEYPVVPKLVNGDQTIDVESAIALLASKVKEEVLPIATTELGKLTLAAFILLEVYHLTGLPEKANELIRDFSSLTDAALCCAIGIEVGRRIPKSVRIETVKAETQSSTGLRQS